MVNESLPKSAFYSVVFTISILALGFMIPSIESTLQGFITLIMAIALSLIFALHTKEMLTDIGVKKIFPFLSQSPHSKRVYVCCILGTLAAIAMTFAICTILAIAMDQLNILGITKLAVLACVALVSMSCGLPLLGFRITDKVAAKLANKTPDEIN